MSHTTEVETYDENTATSDRTSVTSLLKELRDEGTVLFRQEIQLAKQEMSEKVARMGRTIGYLVVGGLMAYAGVVVVLVAISALTYAGFVSIGLSHMVAGWLAPLIVGGIIALIGFSMVRKAQHTLAEEAVVPERTVQSLREDKKWAQEKVTS
ncbi:MAG: phage holin family protein [Planctomycetaceae bacterium]|nr:phage holin family protein [Planctomycetaceae bacterium]